MKIVIQNSHGFFTRTRTRTMSLFYEGFKAHPYPYYQPKKELEKSLITVIGKWMYSNFCGSTIWNMKMDGLQFIWQQLKDIQKSFFLGEPRKCVLCFGLGFFFGRAKKVIYISNKGIFRGSLLVRVRPHRWFLVRAAPVQYGYGTRTRTVRVFWNTNRYDPIGVL